MSRYEHTLETLQVTQSRARELVGPVLEGQLQEREIAAVLDVFVPGYRFMAGRYTAHLNDEALRCPLAAAAVDIRLGVGSVEPACRIDHEFDAEFVSRRGFRAGRLLVEVIPDAGTDG